MINNNISTQDDLIICCSCSHLGHTVRFSNFPASKHDRDNFEAYIDVSLQYERSWFKRLRIAIRYLFRDTCAYGNVSEVIIRDKDLPSLRAWLDRAELDSTVRKTNESVR